MKPGPNEIETIQIL